MRIKSLQIISLNFQLISSQNYWENLQSTWNINFIIKIEINSKTNFHNFLSPSLKNNTYSWFMNFSSVNDSSKFPIKILSQILLKWKRVFMRAFTRWKLSIKFRHNQLIDIGIYLYRTYVWHFKANISYANTFTINLWIASPCGKFILIFSS